MQIHTGYIVHRQSNVVSDGVMSLPGLPDHGLSDPGSPDLGLSDPGPL